MSLNPRVWARLWRRRCWRSMTVKPPVMGRRWCAGAAGGVSHALGVPGASPLREIRAHQGSSGPGALRGTGESTCMGNAERRGIGRAKPVPTATPRSGRRNDPQGGHGALAVATDARVPDAIGSVSPYEYLVSCVNAFTHPRVSVPTSLAWHGQRQHATGGRVVDPVRICGSSWRRA